MCSFLLFAKNQIKLCQFLQQLTPLARFTFPNLKHPWKCLNFETLEHIQSAARPFLKPFVACLSGLEETLKSVNGSEREYNEYTTLARFFFILTLERDCVEVSDWPIVHPADFRWMNTVRWWLIIERWSTMYHIIVQKFHVDCAEIKPDVPR